MAAKKVRGLCVDGRNMYRVFGPHLHRPMRMIDDVPLRIDCWREKTDG
jgi:hypothetical protein